MSDPCIPSGGWTRFFFNFILSFFVNNIYSNIFEKIFQGLFCLKKQAKDWKIYPANSSQIPGEIAKIIPAKISLGASMNFSKIIPLHQYV